MNQHNLHLDRRTFMKTSALAAATAMLPRVGSAQEALPAVAAGPDGVVWNKAPCRFCGTGCGVLLGVKEGKVVAVQGDKDADVNKGLCCMKGYHVGLVMYGKDRLTKPRLRVGPGYAEADYKEISWDEAIDIAARKILEKPEKFAMYGSGQWTVGEGYVANKFVKGGLGHNNIDPNARLCMASAATGFNSTYGVDEPPGCYDDLDVCTVVIDWGNNPAENHPVLFSRVMDRRLKGEKVLLIDMTTRRTRTSEQADHVLLFKPNTDLAIANGIAHELCFTHRMHEKEWVKNHFRFRQRAADYLRPDSKNTADYNPETTTLKQLGGADMTEADYLKSLEPYTPEHVEKISGVPADKIRLMAGLMADPKQRVLSWWCMGMNQHTRGTAMNCLVHAIHHLSGQWGRPGAASFSLTGQPSACGTAREVGTFAHLLPGHLPVIKDNFRAIVEEKWNLPPGRISGTVGLHTVKLWSEFCRDGGAVDVAWVQVTNPGQTLPNLHKLFLGKRDRVGKFLIVSEAYPNATTALADLILPSAMYVEKNGMYGNAERKTQHWFKMVQPPGEARDDAWQTVAVSHRLFELGHPGMKDKDGNWLFARTFKKADGTDHEAWKWDQYYAQGVNTDEMIFNEYRPFTLIKHKDLAPYSVYVKAHGLRWPVLQQADGSWKETRWRFVRGFEGADPYVDKLRPQDAKGDVWFYHSITEDGKAFIWSHPYELPAESPDEQYPYWLCTGRVIEHWHTGTMTMRVPQLRRAMPMAYVEVHPDDAAGIGVRSGDRVVIESRRGTMTLPAWINGRGQVVKGSVFVPFFDERLLINVVTIEAHDPFSKQPDFKKCAVRIRKA